MTCALQVFGGPVSNRRVTEFGRPSRLFVSTTSTRRTSACWPRRSRKTLLASTPYSTPQKVGSRFPTQRLVPRMEGGQLHRDTTRAAAFGRMTSSFNRFGIAPEIAVGIDGSARALAE